MEWAWRVVVLGFFLHPTHVHDGMLLTLQFGYTEYTHKM